MRSPTTEKPTAARHKGRNAASDTWNHWLPAIATSALTVMPPNNPSQVFPGDTSGASRMRPNCRPKKNAPMSATHTSSRANNTHCAPSSGVSRSRASASHAGTSASTPAMAADQGDTRRGANTIQTSAASHHTTATLSTRSRPAAASQVSAPTGGPSRSGLPSICSLVSAMLTAPPSTIRTWNSTSPSGRGALAIE